MKDKKDAADTAKIDEMLLLQSLVLDQIGDHVTITGLDGKITYVNNAELKLIGRSLQEVVGSSTAIYGEDPERGATQKQILEKTLKAGAWRSDVVNIAADGTRHVMDCRTQVVRDDSGAPIAICGISTDITERKRMEAELRESEERFRTLADHLPIGVQGYNAEGIVFYWNRSSERIYGYSAQEAIGRDLGDLIIPDEIRPMYRKGLALGAAMTTSGEFLPAGELNLRRKDGSRVTIHSMHTVVCYREKPSEFYCLDVDLTEHRRMEEELKKKMNQIEEINRHMMGREMRVIEMKKEVNALLAELGREAKYSL